MSAKYVVYFEGGEYTHAERSAVIEHYRQALERHYGSVESVVEAIHSTDDAARERWITARAHARWVALGPHGYSGVAQFGEEAPNLRGSK